MSSARSSQVSIASATASPEDHTSSSLCTDRHDDHGIWNQVKVFCLYLLHFVSCLMLVMSMIVWVHNRDFGSGDPGSIFKIHSRLHQTQVNGILSFALVLIRLVAGACSTLLIWTMILILLEKRGMSFGEILRLNDYRVPIIPRISNRIQALWFAWALSAVFLLWPHGFSAPLVNSALAWIPGTRLVDKPEHMSMGIWGPKGDTSMLTYDWRMPSVMNAVVMAGSDPAYAFDRTARTHRRYFTAPPDMTDKSQIDVKLPYFDVRIDWIDASSDNRSERLEDSRYSDYMDLKYPNGPSGLEGSVMLLRDRPLGTVAPQKPAPIKKKQRLVAIRVGEWNKDTEDGSPEITANGPSVTENTPCPDNSTYFSQLPATDPYKVIRKYLNEFIGIHCYQVGIVTITAGLFQGENCDIRLQGSNASATCSSPTNLDDVQEDWAATIAIEMISEVSKYVRMVYPMYEWMDKGIDDFTTGLLTLAYHASWSSVMATRAKDTEDVEYQKAEPVVRASVDKGKLFGWLAMQLCLSVSAILVHVALRFSNVKVIRDTTLAALTLDFTEITHDPRASGLCNAVALSEKDGKLPMVRFDSGENKLLSGGEKASSETHCCRRVVFMNEHEDHV